MILYNLYPLFINKNHNELIEQLFKNYDSIENIIKNNNIQYNENVDIITSLSFYYKNNKLIQEEIDFIPVIIKKIVYFLVKKYKSYINFGEKEFSNRTGSDVQVRSQDKYYTNLIKNDFMTKLFLLQSLFFSYEAYHQFKLKNTYFVGLDLEFNNNKIALMQICLFPRNKGKYIWILDPNVLSKDFKNKLINNLFINTNIYNIVHGADSLDIPYMFHDFFLNDKDLIFKYIKRVIDTRFLCEFHKLVLNETNKKCSIYDALLYFGTIDDKIYYKLLSINKKMGPIHHINWNIHKLTEYHIKYALYDVLFLREFLFDILRQSKEIKNINPKNSEIVPELTRFVYLEKWNITNVVSSIKSFVEQVNIKVFDSNNMKQNYNSIFTDFLNKNNYITEINLDINHLLNINYLKSTLLTIFKFIFYITLSKIGHLNISDLNIHEQVFEYSFLENTLDKLKMHKLLKLFELFISHIHKFYNS